ncbi:MULTISPECIES: tRNA pseudouridine(38-40) synthase TruA [unclassified Brevibacterium]|uniref:tRNA pseudouridine(38-40) synthase TruA n=1 Tax=unclassified Brevibacterium TaxID=2614124 RepID=UPI001E65711E|nr:MULTISPECIES: tRNA pseudouridine(38-40) synthase TruA [unclassified Brevibacterium]MCD1285626.1 tRNA pseudouridine(38-40) synthase TruA [Brevibacterium sp. CCUG 69071]MDK8434682.1 tRNA pseudouridine(38-40) synthase TruA [Brevibacterium sp. H-BE7]
MTRFRIDLGYQGTHFHGWAKQPGLRTVQAGLESGLARITGTEVSTVVAGRTDAGVHARRQVVHIDLAEAALEKLIGRSSRSAEAALVSRLRGALSADGHEDIIIHAVTEVPEDFDARFSALWRAYRYRLADHRSFIDPLLVAVTPRHKGELDAEAMAEAAAEVKGLHDFLPFCKPREGATTIRTMHELLVTRDEDAVITIDLRADAFCHHMVRALVGGLIKVGSGTWPVTRPAELIAEAEAGLSPSAPMFVSPAHGLVLTEVGYPEPGEYALRAAQTMARRDLE